MISPQRKKLIREELIGKRFNKLQIIDVIFGIERHSMSLCKCDCGETKLIPTHQVKNGTVKSCDCLRYLIKGTPLAKTKEYISWLKLRSRCRGLDELHARFYKNKGIIVCERWLHSFLNFLEDMGYAPSPKHTIDRIDSKGNYEPSNCRWATKDVQCRNMASNVYVERDGKRLIFKDWCRELGVSYTAANSRMKRRKLSHEETIDSYLS